MWRDILLSTNQLQARRCYSYYRLLSAGLSASRQPIVEMGKDLELMKAVKDGDVDAVLKILQKSAKHNKHKIIGIIKRVNINFQDSEGMSVLHQAALTSNEQILTILLDNKASVSLTDNKGMTALHYATLLGVPNIVQLLLERGSSIKHQTLQGNTPLHLACQHGHLEVTRLLLNNQADVTLCNKDFRTPLDLACQFGRRKVVDLLLRSNLCRELIQDKPGESQSNSRTTCLHLAARNGHVEIIKMLLHAGANINRTSVNGTCLHEAVMSGRNDVFRLLLELGADVNKRNVENQTVCDMLQQLRCSRHSQEWVHLFVDTRSPMSPRTLVVKPIPPDSENFTANTEDTPTKASCLRPSCVRQESREVKSSLLPVENATDKKVYASKGELINLGCIKVDIPDILHRGTKHNISNSCPSNDNYISGNTSYTDNRLKFSSNNNDTDNNHHYSSAIDCAENSHHYSSAISQADNNSSATNCSDNSSNYSRVINRDDNSLNYNSAIECAENSHHYSSAINCADNIHHYSSAINRAEISSNYSSAINQADNSHIYNSANECTENSHNYSSAINQADSSLIYGRVINRADNSTTYNSEINRAENSPNYSSAFNQSDSSHIYSSELKCAENSPNYSSAIKCADNTNHYSNAINRTEISSNNSSAINQADNSHIYNSANECAENSHNYSSAINQADSSPIYSRVINRAVNSTTYNSAINCAENSPNFSSAINQSDSSHIYSSELKCADNSHHYSSAINRAEISSNYSSASSCAENSSNYNSAINRVENSSNYSSASSRAENSSNYNRVINRADNSTNYSRTINSSDNSHISSNTNNRESMGSSNTDDDHPPTSYSFPATPSSSHPLSPTTMHSSNQPRCLINQDYPGVDSGFSSLYSVPQLAIPPPAIQQQIVKSLAPFSFGPTLSANDCLAYTLTGNKHVLKSEHIPQHAYNGDWANTPVILPAQFGVGVDMRGSSPAKESPGHSNRNSAGSSDSGRGCSTGYTDSKQVHNYVNVQVNSQQQQHRLSDQSYESGVSSRQSYQSTSSSSHGSLDHVEETNSQATINVTQLVRAGVPDNEVLNAWLHDLHFEEYYPLFVQAGYDLPTISRMTPEDLTAVGITKPVHRKRLKAEIARLCIPDGLPDFRPNDLIEWLHILGLGDYQDTLCGQGYDNIDYVTDITWEDLEEIGITKLGHQKKIMLAIDRLKRIPPTPKHIPVVDGRTATLELLEPPPPAPPVTGQWSDAEPLTLSSYAYEGGYIGGRAAKCSSDDEFGDPVNDKIGGMSNCGVQIIGGMEIGPGDELRHAGLHQDVGIAGAMPYHHHHPHGCGIQPDLVAVQIKKNARSSTYDDRKESNAHLLMYQSFQGSSGQNMEVDLFMNNSGSRSYNADSSGYSITGTNAMDGRTFTGRLVTKPDGEKHEYGAITDTMKVNPNNFSQKSNLSNNENPLSVDTRDAGGEHIYDVPQISPSQKSSSIAQKNKSSHCGSMSNPLHVNTIIDSSASHQSYPSPVGKAEKKIPPLPPVRTNSIRTDSLSESTPSSPVKTPFVQPGFTAITTSGNPQPTNAVTTKQPPPVMQKPQKPRSPSLTIKSVEQSSLQPQSPLAKSPSKVLILPTSSLQPKSPTPPQGNQQMPVLIKPQQPKSPIPNKSTFPALINHMPKQQQQQQQTQHQAMLQQPHKSQAPQQVMHNPHTASNSYKPHIMPNSPPSHKPYSMPTSPPSHKPSIMPTSSPSHKPHIMPTSPPTHKPQILPNSPPSHKPHLVLIPQTPHKTHIPLTPESMSASQIPKNQPNPHQSPHHIPQVTAIPGYPQSSHVQAFASCVKSLSEKFGKNSQDDDQFPDNASTDSDDFPPPPPPIAMDIITPKIHNYGIPSARDKRRPEYGMHHQRDYAQKSRPTTVPSVNFSSITGPQLENAKKNLSHNQSLSHGQSHGHNQSINHNQPPNHNQPLNHNQPHNVQPSVMIETPKTLHESPLSSTIHLKKQAQIFSGIPPSPGRDTESTTNESMNTISREKRSESTSSFDSNSSSSSVDSNTLPFANENVGTIKSKSMNLKPVPQLQQHVGMAQRNVNSNQNTFSDELHQFTPGYSNGSSVSQPLISSPPSAYHQESSVAESMNNAPSSTHAQPHQTQAVNPSSSPGALQPPQVTNYKPPLSPKPAMPGLSSTTTSSSSPAKTQQVESTIVQNQQQTSNVLSDIDDMLQGLTDELDAMLEQEMAS